jgi:hypothetical protein
MQPKLPHPERLSYLRHRKQRNLHILLPVIGSAVLMLVVTILLSLATFQSNGDVARWAAVSTIWLSIPVIFGGLIVCALLGALVYGMARALNALPLYTGMAQDYIYIARTYIIRAADSISGALIETEGFLANIKSFLQRIKA